MGERRVIHAITPGDHFSPRTGSAVPTVVHLLADAAVRAGAAPHGVILDRSTMTPRYGNVELIEYDRAPGVTRSGRYLDAIAGRLGFARPRLARWYSPVAEAVRDLPPADVLAHNAPILPQLLRGTGHRVSIYAHNQLFRTYARREADRTVGGAHLVICVSDALAEETRALLPRAQRAKVVVAENPVDTTRFSPPARRAEGPRPLRVLFVGRMIPSKGPDVLARAAQAFAPDEAEFVFVGSHGFDRHAHPSAYEREVRELARTSRARVTFLPFADRDALPALYRDADVLAVPSVWAEPSGLILGEGMASGLPIVASRTGGIPSVVGDVAVLVPPNDPDALAAALRELIRDPAARARRGEAGVRRARQRDPDWAWARLRALLDES
ncbi:Spore coat protein SA [Microbacterium sp. 8M]|uniref:glycosyltransferase family 4 protein n=1 Tax=Microbacterium sp. 8M TaxID=2653153 RepID=UPI0012EF573F|nr:glycosyltransferase family 4 protein [Microbacterium sp. 8M]VXB74364.1 Spore coat protein SA [Microbacterium sp. 8M]